MPLVGGATFAGYTILRLLGSGGMGEVYLAQHPRLPRRDALKILGNDVSADDDYRQRFIREADLAATLWHPNIVRVNDRGEFDGQLWIAMDFVDGADAASLLRDRYPAGMPADEVVAIIAAIASALDYAHQHDLLHRDVKPANILLTHPGDGDQRILLGDFGIARNIGDISGLTATNMTIGTLPYAAPEQLTDEPIDGRADQYALAATAYHLLTGSPLFPNSNAAVVISRHLTAAPPALSDTRPGLTALDPVLAVALAKDPVDRFSRCADFARAFAKAAQSGSHATALSATMAAPVAVRPSGSTEVSSAEAGANKQQRRSRRRILLTAAMAVIVLATVGAIGYMSEKNNTASKPAPPAAVLDGTYRLDYNYAQETIHGSPNPPPASQPQTETFWAAYRSTCTATGCVATGTALDKNNHQIAATPSGTSEYHFVEKHWQRVPIRDRVQRAQCSVVEDKQEPGSDTEVFTNSMEPQPDGTLRGLRTETAITSECEKQGGVWQDPFVATRVGDVPPGVTIADPATVVSAPTTSTSAAAAAGPMLDGTYLLDYDGANVKTNGARDPGTSSTEWWAFHSSCKSTGCVATGAELDDANHQEAKGASNVLQFADAHWQDTPWSALLDCAEVANRAPNPTDKVSVDQTWSWEPQPDGTLRGVKTITLPNGCSLPRRVLEFPFVATRVGDVPPHVIVADPTLF
jgi:serine/threonine-protein kinase